MKVTLKLKPSAEQLKTVAFLGPFKKKKPVPKPSGKPQIKHEMNLAPKKDKTPGSGSHRSEYQMHTHRTAGKVKAKAGARRK